MTWNDHVLYQRAAMEFMGLRPPPAEFAFGFLDAPPPRRRRCRAPHPLDHGPDGHAEAHAPAEEPATTPKRPYSMFARRPLSAAERAFKRESDRILREAAHLIPQDAPDDCRPGMPRGLRPCPWVRCRFNLAVTVNDSGSIKVDHGHLDFERLEETCAIDVANRHKEGVSQERAAELTGVTEDRIRQVERALRVRLTRKLGRLRGEVVEDDEEGDEADRWLKGRAAG